MDLITLVFIISALYYFAGILYFIIGLLKKNVQKQNKIKHAVSIIIAVYNGEKNLERLLTLLKNQTYNGIMEFIIVDDQSIDNTKSIIDSFIKLDQRFKYFSSSHGNPDLTHKKRALDLGIQKSKYEHLLFTDVDCIIQPYWVESMISHFNDKTDYLIGYSYTNITSTTAAIFQKIDFFMLLSAARSMVNNKSAWACSGQNQGYKKSLYNSVGGFSKIANQIQGDDSLFLLLSRKFSSAKISFASSTKSFVKCRPELYWNNFLRQRIRWAGDAKIFWKFNVPFYLTSIFTFLLNLNILIYPLIIPLKDFSLKLYISLIFVKFIIEYIMYMVSNKIFSQKSNLVHFVLWFLIQPIYVAIVASASILNFNPKWKDKTR